MIKKTIAFTLAEVLITLGIIGVVAAMTIPTLMNNTNNQEIVSRVKKVYSSFTQAFSQAELNDGPVDGWGWIASGSGAGAINVLNVLSNYLSITKNCGTADLSCFPSVGYKDLNGLGVDGFSTANYISRAILNDGTSIAIITRSANCTDVRGATLALTNSCGAIYADVNGFRGPNQVGKDLFLFYITKYGIVPLGTAAETAYPPSDCDKTQLGKACAAWVLEKGNMDYLK